MFFERSTELSLFTWMGDSTSEAIACLLRYRGFLANAGGPGVEVSLQGCQASDVLNALGHAGRDPVPPIHDLLTESANLQREKWDWALPRSLLCKSYGSSNLNLSEAQQCLLLLAEHTAS